MFIDAECVSLNDLHLKALLVAFYNKQILLGPGLASNYIPTNNKKNVSHSDV